MKFGEVFDYRTAEEARQFLGKKGVFSDKQFDIIETPMEIMTERPWTLVGVCTDENGKSMFINDDGYAFQFFRPVLEEAELMTHRQLSEWLANGKGEYSYETSSLTFNYWQYSKGDEDKPVEGYILIRRWNDTEWVKPTKEIYEEDCMPDTIINKEDC